MAGIVVLLVILIFVGIIFGVTLAIKKDTSSMKVMLLGISIMVFSAALKFDANSWLVIVNVLIALLGLFLSILGFAKRD